MKSLADKHWTKNSSSIRDWVWLKLQPYRQTSVQMRTNQKLTHKCYGPFQIADTVGSIPCKLTFPSSVKIHNVFHVSQLKGFRGTLPSTPHITTWLKGHHVTQGVQSLAVLDRRVVKGPYVADVQYLVQWADCPASNASWMFASAFEAQFPDFVLQSSGQDFFEGGRYDIGRN